jgi:hypothetical protein
MPVSGRVLTKASPGPLGDVNRLRYTYIDNGGTVEALPLTAALGQYMSVPWKYSTASDVIQALKTDELQRHFRCPSQGNLKPGWTLYDSNGWCYGWDEYSSYIFDGYVLTVGKSPTGAACPGGQVTQVRLPSEVFLFADGNNT